MFHQLKRLAAAAVILAFALTLFGCRRGPKLAPVHGSITYKGKPVPQGTILFTPENGPSATGEIKDGQYSLMTDNKWNGAVPGKHTVTIMSLADQAGLLPEHRSPLPPPIVPLEYSFADKSGLTAQVEDKDNVIDFHLPLKPAGR